MYWLCVRKCRKYQKVLVLHIYIHKYGLYTSFLLTSLYYAHHVPRHISLSVSSAVSFLFFYFRDFIPSPFLSLSDFPTKGTFNPNTLFLERSWSSRVFTVFNPKFVSHKKNSFPSQKNKQFASSFIRKRGK